MDSFIEKTKKQLKLMTEKEKDKAKVFLKEMQKNYQVDLAAGPNSCKRWSTEISKGKQVWRIISA